MNHLFFQENGLIGDHITQKRLYLSRIYCWLLRIMKGIFTSKHYFKTFTPCSVHKSLHETIDNFGLIQCTIGDLTTKAYFTDRDDLNHHRDKGMDIWLQSHRALGCNFSPMLNFFVTSIQAPMFCPKAVAHSVAKFPSWTLLQTLECIYTIV